MPKTHRDALKGATATAILDLDRSLVQIQEIEGAFEPAHPELAEGLTIAASLIIHAQQVLEAFYAAAWEKLPGNWEATRNRK